MELTKPGEVGDYNSLQNGKSENNEPRNGGPLESEQHNENKTPDARSCNEKESEIVKINEDNVEKRKSGIGDAGILIIDDGKQIKDVGEGSTVINIIAKCTQSDDEDTEPPALPPRPPPRPRQLSPCTCACDCGIDDGGLQQRFSRRPPRSCWANGLRKYVFLCTACGSLSIMLGALFLTVYFMLKSYTSSLDHFETIPTYVPSGMLITTGCLITCLACRKNRNSFLMKLCGLCSLCCAILCVAVTVTTTVIHMNRLQTLRECLYTQKTQSCTCYSGLTDNDRTSDEGIKFVFNSTRDCEVIHGALYSCLRAIFGLSVIGILICIFSCMLIYQLLSHEKKKMYWAQLEMRCRYLYRQQRNPHYCSCCDECRYPPPPHELFPWELMGNRFWSTGRIGNLYTPNPEDRGNQSRLRSGWNWRRLPWNRGANATEPSRGNLGSPDSQYGFNSGPTVEGTPYTVIDPRAQTVISGCHTGLPPEDVTEGGFYSWGPPPPYASNRNSANNSPARRSLGDILHQVSPIRRNDNVSPVRPFHHVLHHHHLHHPHSINHQCSTSASRQMPNVNDAAQPGSLQKTAPSRIPAASDPLQQQLSDLETVRSNSLSSVHRYQKILRNKDNYENTYESENLPSANGFNTLPSLKKRNQPRVGDLFQNETTAGYYFSSAENLGCADSNVGNENLPPRVYLTDDVPDRGNSRDRQESGLSETCKPVKSSENNSSDGNKILTNPSPTRQRQRNETESHTLPREKKDVAGQAYRRKFKKKPGSGKDCENGNDNVTPSHYRMGMVRSPTVQNFNQIIEKGLKSEANEETGDKCLEIGNNKVLKNLKLMSKDAELLEKHGSLMREFNKSMDLQKNIRLRREKAEGSAFGGIDNQGFQNLDETPGKSRTSRNYQQDLIKGPNGDVESSASRSGRSHCKPEEMENPEEFSNSGGSIKNNENESDVYFGDVSNSSCYTSVQNDGVDSFLYEEASERRSGRSLLSKQNLKLMENETPGYKRCQNDPEDSRQNRRQRNLPPSHRYRPSHDVESESASKSDSERRDNYAKNRRRQLVPPPRYDEAVENNGNYSNHLVGRGFQDRFRSDQQYRETIHSNDEQSSGSLTADSGISSGRSFAAHRNFESPYQEINLERKQEDETRKTDARADSGFETLTLNERFGKNEKYQSFSTKITDLDNLDFSHPLFQKPKIVPRGNRFKDPDPRPKRNGGTITKTDHNNESESENKKARTSYLKYKSVEGSEEVTNHLLNSYNLGFASDSESFLTGSGTSSGTESQSKRQSESGLKSPVPLPRIRAASKSPQENLGYTRHLKYVKTNNEKVGNHFLAPDAQYEYQENYKSESKQKNQVKTSQNFPKTKPVVPARPLNLQNVSQHRNRSPKVDNINVQIMRSVNENYCKSENSSGSMTRRRQQHTLDDPDDKDNLQIDNISVNV